LEAVRVARRQHLAWSSGLLGQTGRVAVGRAETLSSWDLAHWQPKPAQRVAPTGRFYWFEDFQGDPGALGKLADTGLWGLPGQKDDAQRRAEGFNNVAVGSWA
jgi:CRISPR-associated protein Cmr3